MSGNWLDLSQKVIVVTGGSMGIGENIVRNLLDNGAKVVIADLVENEEQTSNDSVLFVPCDITKKTTPINTTPTRVINSSFVFFIILPPPV